MFELNLLDNFVCVWFSVLQRVRGTATIGLAYINPGTSLLRTDTTESENGQQNDGFEIIHHRDLPQSLTESPLPPGWEGEKFFSLLI